MIKLVMELSSGEDCMIISSLYQHVTDRQMVRWTNLS